MNLYRSLLGSIKSYQQIGYTATGVAHLWSYICDIYKSQQQNKVNSRPLLSFTSDLATQTSQQPERTRAPSQYCTGQPGSSDQSYDRYCCGREERKISQNFSLTIYQLCGH